MGEGGVRKEEDVGEEVGGYSFLNMCKWAFYYLATNSVLPHRGPKPKQ